MATSDAHILVVDDEPDLRTLYELTLLRIGYRVDTAGNLAEARAQLQRQHFDVLITDMRLPDGLGMELLQELHAQQRPERVIVMTAFGSADNAVQALRLGAFDYLTKPVDLPQFRAVVTSAVQGRPTQPPGLAPAPNAQGDAALDRLVGDSPAMHAVRQRVRKVAAGMAPVLIHGESGTGKELVARALHGCSHRSSGPWVAVNCGAIPEHLLEAEFFGVRKGAYTGATADRPGFFQAAAGGSLFLDEIGELPLAMQAKLLRAIQERSVRPLGATQEESVDVRIVSASHRDLAAEVAAQRFRQDLFYRLNVIDITLPALRERRQDLPALCQVLLQRIAQENGLPLPALSPQLLQQLQAHPLPGNVRELENLLYRSLALDEPVPPPQPTAAAPALPTTPHAASAPPAPVPAGDAPTAPTPTLGPLPQAADLDTLPHDLQAWLDAQERNLLLRALQAHGYNRTAAAARLGISLRQMRYRIERLNIPVDPQEPEAPPRAAARPPPPARPAWPPVPPPPPGAPAGCTACTNCPPPTLAHAQRLPASTWPWCTASACHPANTARAAYSNCSPTSWIGTPTPTSKAFAG